MVLRQTYVWKSSQQFLDCATYKSVLPASCFSSAARDRKQTEVEGCTDKLARDTPTTSNIGYLRSSSLSLERGSPCSASMADAWRSDGARLPARGH